MAFDPYMMALMAQGGANALGNLGNAQRGQRTVPMNNAPLLMAMMNRQSQQDSAVEREKATAKMLSSPDLSPKQRESLASMLALDEKAGVKAYGDIAFPSADKKMYSLSPGGAIVDPSGKVVYKNPIAPKKSSPKGISGAAYWDPESGTIKKNPYWRPSSGGGGGGGSSKERLMSRYLDLEARKGSLNPREEADRRLLEHNFSSMRTSSGDVISVRPPALYDEPTPDPLGAIPPTAPVGPGTIPPGAPMAEAPMAGTPMAQAPEGSGRVDTIYRAPEDTGSAKWDLSIPRQYISDIRGLLDDSKRKGETVTGVVGYAKANFGGFARQAGIPVSPAAEALSIKLDLLSSKMARVIKEEKRLTDTERKNVDELVGQVSAAKDDVSLRLHLDELEEYTNKLDSRYKGGSVLPTGAPPPTGAPKLGPPPATDPDVAKLMQAEGISYEEFKTLWDKQ